jgi:hypothetical protein
VNSSVFADPRCNLDRVGLPGKSPADRETLNLPKIEKYIKNTEE